MSERKFNPKELDVSNVQYWKQLVKEFPHAGNVVQYDADSPFEELLLHNTILHLVMLNFYSLGNSDEEVVSLLLDYGADPNIQNDKGETSLHLICQTTMRDPEIAKLLLSKGADPTIQTTKGVRAIDFLGHHDRYSSEIRAILEEKAE
jgi:ankyrin repeat protein